MTLAPATLLKHWLLGYPLVLYTDLDPAECARRLQADVVDARGLRRGADAATQSGDRPRREEFVIRTTFRRRDPRESHLFLAARLVPDGGGTAIVCRHTAFLRRWARDATIVALIVGLALLAIVLFGALAGWQDLDWMLFGLPLVVFALARLNAPFTARARREREAIAWHLARLVAAHEKSAVGSR